MLTVVALGTSLTSRGGWMQPLQRELEVAVGSRIGFQSISKSGASSTWGVKQLPALIERKPTIVLVEFAANDAALNRGVSLSASARNHKTIIEGIRAGEPGVKIFLMTMNPIWGWRRWIRPRLDAYYALYGVLAARMNTGFIDNLPSWNFLSDKEQRRAIADGSHPDATVAERIMVPNIMCALRASGAILLKKAAV
jgi:lysophospholipase L1-like esterase